MRAHILEISSLHPSLPADVLWGSFVTQATFTRNFLLLSKTKTNPFFERMLAIGPKIMRFYLSYILLVKAIFNFFINVKRLWTLKE